MKKVQTKKMRVWREIEHNRGKIVEGKSGFHSLIINADPLYHYTNWTTTDLKDLADSINAFLETIA